MSKPRSSSRSARSHGPDRHSVRRYPRVARVNQALREVLADELEILDDDRLTMVTITGIEADPDLRRATVYFSALTSTRGLDIVSAGLADHRIKLQAAVGRELRLKFTPLLSFAPDPAIIEGDKIESIIKTMLRSPDVDDVSALDDDPSRSVDGDATANIIQSSAIEGDAGT